MKSVPAGLLTTINGEVVPVATLWTVTRRDGVVLRFTDHDADVSFGGETYSAEGAFSRSTVVSKENLAVDTLDLEGAFGVLDSEDITDEDIRAGKYDFARVDIQLVDWTDPDGKGALTLKRGTLGEVKVRDEVYEVEFRGMAQQFSIIIGENYTEDCRADLFDAAGANRCKLDPDGTYNAGTPFAGLPYKEASEVSTQAGDRRTFTVPANYRERTTLDESLAETQGLQVDEDGNVTMLAGALQDGTPLRPFQVDTPAKLDGIRADLNACYVLTADIDMGSFGFFEPIAGFAGLLDGRGFQVQNLDVDRPGAAEPNGPAALFESFASGAEVRRVGIVGGAFRAGNSVNYAAPMAADAANATIEDCYAEGGTVTTDADEAGGFVGQADSTTTMRRCYSAVTISGSIGGDVGGFTGSASTAPTEADTYYDDDAGGAGTDAGAATALTTAQAQQQASYEPGFDFENDWKVAEGSDYPRHLDPGRCS